jgi:membrane-associated protease RseP (regulator of RpoE activity)
MRKTLISFLACLFIVTSAFAQVEKKQVFIKDGKVIEGDDEDVIVLRHGEFSGKRTFLGVATVDLSDGLRDYFGVAKDSGVLISTVTADSPAAKAGLRAGDVVTAIDGKPVDSAATLGRLIREKKTGDQVRVEFRRGNTSQQAFATLAEREGMGFPDIKLDRKMIQRPLVIAGEAVKDIEAYFEGPEWTAKLESLQDCSRVQSRVKELEKRLAELEKKLNE